uniref:Protein kinase domain-containing protein n=1 Tax=viral metagenome TaxID=1070528 RepID=A0A6C0JQD9_9ZZZZ
MLSFKTLSVLDESVDKEKLESINYFLKLMDINKNDSIYDSLFKNIDIISSVPLKITSIKKLNKGKYGLILKGCLEIETTNKKYSECNYPIILKIIGYRKKTSNEYETLSIDNKTRPENVEWEIHTLIYNLLSSKQSIPHTSWPFLSLMVNIKKNNFLHILLKEENFKPNTLKNFYKINFCEYISLGTIEEYFIKFKNKNASKEILHILFQVLMTLAIIQEKYPSFIHNDLHTKNVLLKDVDKKTTISYELNNKIYKIKNIGFITILNDFDFSEIKPSITNSKTNTFFGKNRVLKGYTDVYRFTGALLDLISEYGIKVKSDIGKFIFSISLADEILDFDQPIFRGVSRKEKEQLAFNVKKNNKFIPYKLIKRKIFKEIISNS